MSLTLTNIRNNISEVHVSV